jgi:hypothetical protein
MLIVPSLESFGVPADHGQRRRQRLLGRPAVRTDEVGGVGHEQGQHLWGDALDRLGS